jgi:2-hydroxy-6-oxonona-2,4-dienedioate hydrolase
MNDLPNRKLIVRALRLALAAVILTAGAGLASAQEESAALRAAQQPQIAGAAEKVVTLFGAKIHYVEAGSGPVVILLHGLGADWTSWAATVGPLSQKYRVIALDQVGFGRSDKPMIAYRIGTLVDFLDALYKELKINRASLVGNSLGGWTAAAFAIAHPEKVDRLVLVDAAGIKQASDLSVIQYLNPSTIEGAKKILSLVLYNKALVNDMAAAALLTRRVMSGDGYTVQQFIEAGTRGDDLLDGRLGAIKLPTLIVWGREDALTPLAMGERFRKDISGSQLVIFDKCGHVPQLEKAAEFNAALIKFLGGEVANK